LVNFKIVISDKLGKSLSHELKDKDAQPFLGSKIGDTFDSSLVGLAGGKLQITGGSDKSGTPMRSPWWRQKICFITHWSWYAGFY